MITTDVYKDLDLVKSDIKLLTEFRKELLEAGSVVLTIAEHDQALNHLANTLFAFKIFLEMNQRSETSPSRD